MYQWRFQLKKIEQASYDDEEESVVNDYLRSGNWNQSKAAVSYWRVKDELCVYGELLLCGASIFIPKAYVTEQPTKIAHEGHQGIRVDKTKTRLRSKV